MRQKLRISIPREYWTRWKKCSRLRESKVSAASKMDLVFRVVDNRFLLLRVHRPADEELVGLAHHVGTSMPALFKLELDKLRKDNAKLQSREVLIQCCLLCFSQSFIDTFESVTEILESDITELPVSESVELVHIFPDHCPLYLAGNLVG